MFDNDKSPFACGCALCARNAQEGERFSSETIENPSAITGNNSLDSLLAISENSGSARWNYPSNGTGRDVQTGIGVGVSLSYSFMEKLPDYYQGPITIYGGILSKTTFVQFTEAQKASARRAFAELESITQLRFTEVSDAIGGEIRFGKHPMTQATAYAYYPSESGYGGDVWFDTKYADQPILEKGSDYVTLHELGHAMGLKHSFQGSYIIPQSNENTQWTVMSYSSMKNNLYYVFTGTENNYSYVYKFLQPNSYGVYDIQALQYLYGKNTTTNSGDNVYQWSKHQGFYQTIWDAGGIDTIDLTNQTLSSRVDLTPGTQSSINRRITQAEKQIDWLTKSIPVSAYAYDGENNLGIAFGVTIENVKLGSGADQVLGNSADNQITGNGGNDTIDGGSGTDTAVYSGTHANYKIAVSGTSVTVTDMVGAEGTDTLTNVEYLKFADKTVSSLGVPLITVAPVTVTEGNSGTTNATFTITLSEAASSTVTMTYATAGGTATGGIDFVEKSGTVTFTAGQTSQSVQVSIIGDGSVEADETFTLTFSNPAGAVFTGNGTSLSVMGTILNDDTTAANDVVLLQANSPAVTSAAAGNDTYILSGTTASKAGSFTLTDTQGSNSLQLVAGLSIKSFVVAANALQLTLASGAEITILDANLLTYEVGGNRIAGIDNSDVSFAAFASSALGVTVPTSGTVTGGAKTLGTALGTGTFTVASASDNIVLPQANSPAVLSSAAGNDTYILSPHLLTGAGAYTISDSQGVNSLQIVSGVTISSFVVASTALQLTFSTGAVVTVLEADKFGYEVGGNVAAGINGTDISFSTFVNTHLGVSVPTSGTVTGGSKSFAAPMIETLGLTMADGYLL